MSPSQWIPIKGCNSRQEQSLVSEEIVRVFSAVLYRRAGCRQRAPEAAPTTPGGIWDTRAVGDAAGSEGRRRRPELSSKRARIVSRPRDYQSMHSSILPRLRQAKQDVRGRIAVSRADDKFWWTIWMLAGTFGADTKRFECAEASRSGLTSTGSPIIDNNPCSTLKGTSRSQSNGSVSAD